MNRIRQMWEALHSSFWFIPTCLVLFAGILGIALVELDSRVQVDLVERFPRVFIISADGAQGMLQAIATSMITVAGVIFSITILILSQASAQYSPRILRNFVRDRRNQVVLGVFLAIFVYCIIVLRSIHNVGEDGLASPIAVLGGIALALIGIGVLIFFIHHIAYSIQASSILQRATSETLVEVDHIYPEPVGVGYDETTSQLPADVLNDENWHGVKATRSGYLEVTDPEGLLNFAEAHDTILRLEYEVGEYVVEDTILVSVHGPGLPPEEEINKLLGAISITTYRTIEQDASFGILQLGDVALKCLSPSMNDTTTAVMCVDHLTSILARLVQRKMESPYRLEKNRLRVIARRPGFADLLNHCFEPIRQNGGGNVILLRRLIHALNTIISLTENQSRLKAIEHQLELIRQTIASTVDFPPDRERLLFECDEVAVRFGGKT